MGEGRGTVGEPPSGQWPSAKLSDHDGARYLEIDGSYYVDVVHEDYYSNSPTFRRGFLESDISVASSRRGRVDVVECLGLGERKRACEHEVWARDSRLTQAPKRLKSSRMKEAATFGLRQSGLCKPCA